jgi:hypothetical protein
VEISFQLNEKGWSFLNPIPLVVPYDTEEIGCLPESSAAVQTACFSTLPDLMH